MQTPQPTADHGHTPRQRAEFIHKGNQKMPNTSALPKEERKSAKRASRKKAAPKAARTHERGAAKQKVKKAARGTSKR
jgi:hypothetical protein